MRIEGLPFFEFFVQLIFEISKKTLDKLFRRLIS